MKTNSLENYSDLEELAKGIQKGDRRFLSRGITLMESSLPVDEKKTLKLIQLLHSNKKSAYRIGVTGIPGVGKSLFIEALGLFLIEKDFKIGVLTIDPTSELSGGSLLGDKTRMSELSQKPRAFIRPSPSRRYPGGTSPKLGETLLLMDSAGFDFVFVETVGVGQGETAVTPHCDMVLLLWHPGAGDELQGSKKGILEKSDAIVVTKWDGPQKALAEETASTHKILIHERENPNSDHKVQVYLVSSLEKTGLKELFSGIENFKTQSEKSGVRVKRRSEGLKKWLVEKFNHQVLQKIHTLESVNRYFTELENNRSPDLILKWTEMEKVMENLMNFKIPKK